MHLARGLCVSLLGVCLGCSEAPPAPTPFEATLGGLVLRLESRPARVVVKRPDGTVLLDGLPGGAATGDASTVARAGIATRDGDATYTPSFGQFRIRDTSTQPWASVTRLDAPVRTGDTVTTTLRDAMDRALGTLTVTTSGAHGLELHVTTSEPAQDRVSFAFGCAPSEHFLGFGGQSFDVDHRGQTVPLWVEEDGIGKAEDDSYTLLPLGGRRHSTHTPMPMYVSSRGYALILDTPVRSIFAMCAEQSDVVRIEAWENDLDLHVYDAPTPREGVERMTELVGRPDPLPDVALAPWLDAIYGSASVRAVLMQARTEDVPASVVWTEDFRGGGDTPTGYALEENWRVSRRLYPDLEALITDAHGLGFAFHTYNNTFLVQDVDVYAEAVAGGFTIEDAAGMPFTFLGTTFEPTTLLDLSNPAAVAWGQSVYREQITAGADGWMADFAEWLPTDARLASGESAIDRHNLYPVDFQRMNRDLFRSIGDGVPRIAFVRSAYLRSQALVSVVWAGDQLTDFDRGDGFPSIIPMGVGLGMTGFPFYAHDIGGYISVNTTPTDRELFFRWAAVGALTPVMRTHHGRQARETWEWNQDAETIAHFRRWAKLHQQLFPYLRALADEGSRSGAPMFRPLAYDRPEFEPGWSITDEYTLGGSIYVAPVVTRGATSRMVRLPPGAYRPLLGGARVVSDGSAFSVDAPVTELPAFVPEGRMIVALPPTVDTVQTATTDASIVTLASVGDDREVWLYGPGTSEFTEGTKTYQWSAMGWSEARAAATWNGAPVTITNGTIELTGAGSLVIDGTATLQISGGASARRITVRLR